MPRFLVRLYDDENTLETIEATGFRDAKSPAYDTEVRGFIEFFRLTINDNAEPPQVNNRTVATFNKDNVISIIREDEDA